MMHSIPMLFRKRKALSTILSVLVLIGIFFSSVVPIRLVKHQADNVRDQITHESELFESEKEQELLSVYPIPSLDSDTFMLTLISKCEFRINVNMMWINDTQIELDVNIPAMDSIELGPFDLAPRDGGRYEISVTTSRGNVFISEVGVLYFNGGKWETETIGFRLIFPSKGKCSKMNPMSISIKDGMDIIHDNVVVYWCISASEMFFEIGESGDYRIIIIAKGDTIYDDIHSLVWPIGDPINELQFEIDDDELEINDDDD